MLNALASLPATGQPPTAVTTRSPSAATPAGDSQADPSAAGRADNGELRQVRRVDQPTASDRQQRLQDPAVQRQLAELSARDREVRAHEQAHVAAGGELITSGPTYSYTTGPDNRRYATGGEVSIDTSEVANDPEATRDKARRIRAAALAPAEPSAQDRQVAARATQMEQQANLEISLRRRDDAYRAAADPAPTAGTLRARA